MWMQLKKVSATTRREALDIFQRLLECCAIEAGSVAANKAHESIMDERALYFDAGNGHFGVQPMSAPNWRFHNSWVSICLPILSQPDARTGLICPLLPAPALDMLRHYNVHGIFDGFEVLIPEDQNHLRAVYATFGFTETNCFDRGHVAMRLPISRVHILARKALPFVGSRNARSLGQNGFCSVDTSSAGLIFTAGFGKKMIAELATGKRLHHSIKPDLSGGTAQAGFCPG